MKPILVTGMHRSGTTWVGKMLAVGPTLAYISEPLNVLHRLGVMRVPTQYWYTYICGDNDEEFIPAFRETLEFNYHTRLELKSLRSVKDVLRMFANWSTFFKGRNRSLVPLLKDPFAVFSVNWFVEKFGCRVVIVVRHPAAVASSLKRLNWNFDFSDLLNQPYLMRDWLESYRDEMLTVAEDVIHQASLLWRMIYRVTDQLQGNNSELIIIRHEDFSQQPLEEFGKLYGKLGLEFTQSVRQAIIDSSSGENPSELAVEDVHSVQLNSLSNLENWKNRLDETEIVRVRELTSDVAPLYYENEDW